MTAEKKNETGELTEEQQTAIRDETRQVLEQLVSEGCTPAGAAVRVLDALGRLRMKALGANIEEALPSRIMSGKARRKAAGMVENMTLMLAEMTSDHSNTVSEAVVAFVTAKAVVFD